MRRRRDPDVATITRKAGASRVWGENAQKSTYLPGRAQPDLPIAKGGNKLKLAAQAST